MGRAYEVVAGRVTNPGATITALTPNTGNSFTVRSFPFESGAFLESMFADAATAGVFRIRSPRFHDQVQGIRFRTVAGAVRDFLPDEAEQMLFPQDPLTVELSGGAAETDVAAFTTYYNDLPGIDARLAAWEQVLPLIRNMLTVEVDVAGAGTLGDWSAGTPLTNFSDLLKANTDYAILGYTSALNVLAIGISGSDTGNLRVGGPGTTEAIETRDWFVNRSRLTGRPHIPVINAANDDGVLVSQVDNAAGATNNVDLILAELGTGV